MLLFILGRQPKIGLVELESLYGGSSVKPLATVAAEVTQDKSETDYINDFKKIGGSIKLCKKYESIPSKHWGDIEAYLVKNIAQYLQSYPEGKIKFGLSVYGTELPIKRLEATGLLLKRTIKQLGKSVRYVPNKSIELNAAQILHNKLTDSLGIEINILFSKHEVIFSKTIAIQDIDAYAARDQVRPKRDARVGMLPPKLAQTIINIASGDTHHDQPTTVLDPFCGTGVVLQESLLMGYEAYGTDLENRMIDYSQINLEWLKANHTAVQSNFKVLQGDATSYTWDIPFSTIACETYLGRPFSSEPSDSILQSVIQDVDTIHKKFLQNVARQTKPGFRLCIAVPAWNKNGQFVHLKILDSLESLGYNRISFAHASNKELIYYRPGQIVGRELVTLIRK